MYQVVYQGAHQHSDMIYDQHYVPLIANANCFPVYLKVPLAISVTIITIETVH